MKPPAMTTSLYHFMDQMLERLAGNEYYCFLDGFSGYFQIPIDPRDQEKTTFTCPYGTFAYRRMPFGLCNAPGTFQRSMLAIFLDMVEKSMEVYMDDFSVFGKFFPKLALRLDHMLQRGSLKESVIDCSDGFLLLQEFDFKVIDTKRSRRTAAKIDLCPDWKNPYENVT
ncbi:reverse transcriptase domain-containing protein [Tanacetum coccineum]